MFTEDIQTLIRIATCIYDKAKQVTSHYNESRELSAHVARIMLTVQALETLDFHAGVKESLTHLDAVLTECDRFIEIFCYH